MKRHVVEIGGDGKHLSLYRGFLSIRNSEGECGRVPLDDIAALVASGHGITYSNDLLAALSKANVPVVLCGSDYAPTGWLWPVQGNFQQALRMDAQASASLPIKKRLWRAIVKKKIQFQADHLDRRGLASTNLRKLITRVRSGDPDNVEAEAARSYWQSLMGRDFRRVDQGDIRNTRLN